MIRVYFKRGDQQVAKGKEHLAYKDGMVAGYIDLKDTGDFKESLQMRKAFVGLILPDSFRPTIKDMALPNLIKDSALLTKTEKNNYLTSKKKIDFVELKKITGLNITNAVYNTGNKVDLIDFSKGGITEKLFIDSNKLVKSEPIKDINAITTGSYTWGTGKDYNLLGLAMTDVGNLSGDLTLIGETATNETGVAKSITNLNSHTLKLTSKNHSGIVGNAYEIGITYNAGHFLDIQNEGSGTIEINNLYFKRLSANKSCVEARTVTTPFTLKINNCFFDGNSQATTAGIEINDAQIIFQLFNNISWDFMHGIRLVAGDGSSVLQNNTSFNNSGIGIYSPNITIKNNLSFSNATDYSGLAGATGYNNADSDGTLSTLGAGSGNQANITYTNELKSISPASSDFCKVIKGGVCYDGGITTGLLANNTSGIRDNVRPWKTGVASIGADEFKKINSLSNRLGVGIGVNI